MPYAENSSLFWMGGRLATDLVEVSHDPKCLDDGGFWAVSTTFENEFTAAKFATVVDAPFPATAWISLQGLWSSTLTADQYVEYVERIRESIAQGWVYQVNACRRLTHPDNGQSLRGLFSEILKNNPAPWASYFEIPGLMIASASPELFLSRSGSMVKSSPIKGTQPNNAKDFGVKDQAENVMIVDLMRNDLGQICKSGTVQVPRLLSSEEHPGLQHLVSDVEGELLDDISWSQILTALSPPGSVSGAPKSSATQVIGENEKARGPYCGALGWVQGNQAVLSVAIRTFWKDTTINFGTGAGITWGSNAQAEWEETQLKARRLISIAGGRSTMKVIVNGSLVPLEQSKCTPQGWLDGAGIFETIRTVDGKPWALSRHMRRAVKSSAKAKISLPSEELVRESITTLLQNETQANGLLRVSFDASGNWAAVHLPYIHNSSPAKVRTHPDALVNKGVPVKSYPYNHRLEILEQARVNGFDEALVTSLDGKICEGAVTNVLLKIAGVWCTPPLSDGVLPGVMRALVVENCDVMVRSISVSEIEDIESAFLLSSLRIAQPIASINGRELSQSHDFRVEIEAMALRTSVG